MEYSATTCDEITDPYSEEKKNYTKNFNEKKATCKTQNLYVLIAFLLITIKCLISVSIYCYVMKYQVKRKHPLPLQLTNDKLKEIMY